MRPPGAASPSAKSIQEDEIPVAVMAGHMKKFSKNTSTTPEVIDSITLIFNPNFKFSRFFSGGGGWTGPSPFRCVLASLGQSLACVKISGRSTP